MSRPFNPFDMDSAFARFAEFFDGFPAQQPNSKVTIEELVRRGTSHVRVNDRIYRVQVTEIELTK